MFSSGRFVMQRKGSLAKRLPSIETERHMGRSLQYSARHSCKALYPNHFPPTKRARQPHAATNSYLPKHKRTSPGSTRPIQSESNLHSAWAGALGGSSGWVREVWRVGRTPPKGVSLRLQGLPHLTPRKLQPTSGTRRGRNGGQDQDRVTLREPSHRSPICRRGDTCCCGEASSAPERRT